MKLILYLGALQPLSNWLDYIPARLGHDAAVDDAALAFVSALDFYYSDRTALAASAAASQHYTTALTSLRTLIDSPGKTCTDDTIVCVALLTFHPLLMYGPGDKRRKDVFAHQSGLKAIFSAVYGASPPSAIAQYIMYSLVETLSVDPVVHDAAAPSLGDDALWPSMNHPASPGRIRQETFSLKQITYRLRVQTSRLNNYVICLRTGAPSPVLLATAIALCQRVAVLKDDELESEILHRVHVVRNRDPCTRALTAISFEFVEVEDLITCVHYWCNRLKAINLCLKVLDLARDDDHRPLQLDRTAMRDDKRRLFRNLLMSWHHASALGAWATLGVARGLMQVWQAIREGSLLPEPGVSKALEGWVAERIPHPFHTWFPSSGAVEELDQAADMLVGGGCPGWLGDSEYDVCCANDVGQLCGPRDHAYIWLTQTHLPTDYRVDVTTNRYHTTVRSPATASDMAPPSKRRKIGDCTGDGSTITSKRGTKTSKKARGKQTDIQEPEVRNTPAATAVLSTTELLEAILLKLNAKTLLLSQQTCHKFQEVVGGSRRLQKKLFFQPAATLGEALSLADGEYFDEVGIRSAQAADENPERGLLNPLFFMNGLFTPMTGPDCRTPGPAQSGEATWRRMVSVSPAPTVFELRSRCGMYGFEGEDTLGPLLDYMEKDYLIDARDEERVEWAGKLLLLDEDMASIASFLDPKRYGSNDSEVSEWEEGEIDWGDWKEMMGPGSEGFMLSEGEGSWSEATGSEEHSFEGYETEDEEQDDDWDEDNERGVEAEAGEHHGGD
ncbi:hypothetical protein LTR53_010167 [Teratosphaeriaceae sp. CCFEE 6253]|nr:hypothetical protein LTR53_010167 [Teratosphaeriaceae sp. CCFEE 6253]